MAKGKLHSKKDWLESPCIKHLLIQKLQEAVSLSGKMLGIGVTQEAQVQRSAIPLYPVKDATSLLYVTPISFKLANSWQRSPIDIAAQIVMHLSSDSALQSFTIQSVDPGSIHLQLSEGAIAAWLQHLAEGGRGAEEPPRPQTLSIEWKGETCRGAEALFPVQYAHARCCSLLRLAHREGIIQLKEPDPEASPVFWEAISPNPLPWLQEDSQLRLVHRAERHLIFHLLTALDALYYPNHQNHSEKLARTLSESFQTFYAQCRIWGEVKTEAPQLAQARLGLILATQSLLWLLLHERLGVTALLEL